MRNPDRSRWLSSSLACALCLWGCAAQTGLSGGYRAEIHGPDRMMWSGQVAALVTPKPGQGGLVFGADLDGNVGLDEGTRWTTGVRLGYASEPAAIPQALGYELHLDLGSELRHASLLEDWNGYAGATAAIVMWLGPNRATTDLNGEQWVMKPVPQLVLFGRGRAIHAADCPGQDSQCMRVSVELGLALRMALLSELL